MGEPTKGDGVDDTRWARARAQTQRFLPVMALAVVAVLAAACETNLPQSTTVIEGSHNATLWVPYRMVFILAAIVFVAVMALTVIFSITYRERPGRTARQFHGNTRLEIVWTLIPIIIVTMISVPTVNAIVAEAQPIAANALRVDAIGHQWWFEFVYLDEKVTTANELHIPEGREVAFNLKSVDVIHSFWVPQLAGKTDMVPGHVNDIKFTALRARPEPYLGQCAEFCGTSHANMRFRVFVHTEADFAAWLKSAAANGANPASALEKQGQEIFMRSACIGCHTVQGSAAAGKVGPDLTHVGSRTTIGSGILVNTPETLEKWIANSADVKPDSKMPPMAKSAGGALSKEEVTAVAAYLSGLK